MDAINAYRAARASAEKRKNDLERFVSAQRDVYPRALSEIRAGRKLSHWMWFIFPQLRGLGSSFKADLYGLTDLDEAKRYMEPPLLGTRLIEISTALTELDTCDPVAVMGSPDDLKLRSCMTLFSALPNAHPVFSNVLDKFYAGGKDPRTLNILNGIPPFIL